MSRHRPPRDPADSFASLQPGREQQRHKDRRDEDDVGSHAKNPRRLLRDHSILAEELPQIAVRLKYAWSATCLHALLHAREHFGGQRRETGTTSTCRRLYRMVRAITPAFVVQERPETGVRPPMRPGAADPCSPNDVPDRSGRSGHHRLRCWMPEKYVRWRHPARH
jgi:hypothetical protein